MTGKPLLIVRYHIPYTHTGSDRVVFVLSVSCRLSIIPASERKVTFWVLYVKQLLCNSIHLFIDTNRPVYRQTSKLD